MTKNRRQGNIDFVKDGFMHGWALATPNITDQNYCELWIDGQLITTFDAVLFREDLKAESLRGGVAGFSQAIPLSFCDDSTHDVSLRARGRNEILCTKTLKIPKNRNLVSLDENIIFDHINRPYEGHEKVLFLAGFTNQRKLLNYQKHFVRKFQQAGFYVVYILASDIPNTLTGMFGDADRVIIRENMGYDFGSWATLLQLCQLEFLGARDVIWANDSIIGPIGTIETLLDKIGSSTGDIWAITDCQDIKYHFQSYMWGLKKNANQFFPLLDAFFFYRHGLPKNKDEAIKNFELEAFSFFKEHNLSIDILFPEYSLLNIAEEKFCVSLQAYQEKWQFLFKLPFMREELHKLNSRVLSMAGTLMHHLPVNPSHVYWNALIDSGFPFIKKELLTLNPTGYPYPSEFRDIFKTHDATDLLDDLASSLRFNQII